MWLVLCEPSDSSALWAFQGLRQRGLAPIELVSPEVLSYSLGWEHRISNGSSTLEITLAGDRTISSETTRGVLNRLYALPVRMWERAGKDDRDYVTQELTALFLSSLHCLPCPVVNRPTPQGLCGRWRTESEWVSLAARAGLRTPRFRQSSLDRIDEMKGDKRLLDPQSPRRTVIVVNGEAIGAREEAEWAACTNLALVSETSLLGIDFVTDARGAWVFAGASPTPDLRVGGRAVLDALARALRGGNREP
jgi:hypothetical protein